MMGFIFLGYKVEVKAVEMVGHINEADNANHCEVECRSYRSRGMELP